MEGRQRAPLLETHYQPGRNEKAGLTRGEGRNIWEGRRKESFCLLTSLLVSTCLLLTISSLYRMHVL